MMMCIGSVSDFEAQMAPQRQTAEDIELAERSSDWIWARCYADDPALAFDRSPTEPRRPYSHGRRFIPAWLAAERARCMWSDDGATAADVWQFMWNSTVVLDKDPSVMRMYDDCAEDPAEPLTDNTGCDV